MKRYTFSAFQVDDQNRAAFELCRGVAELQPRARLPLVLLADKGCGKTHLLYAIVNHIRATSAKTGLAYLTAREFPDSVRNLIGAPEPVKRAESAILLVDDLQDFAEPLDDIEALVRVFLDNRHFVVLASSVHPARLKNLPDGLRGILDGGEVAHFERFAAPAPSDATPQSPTADDDRLRKQQEEIRRLREELEKTEAVAESLEQESLELRRRLDAERAKNSDFSEQLQTAGDAQESSVRELEKVKAEILALRRELDKSQSEASAASELREEIARLRDQLERAQADRDAGRTAREALEAKLAEQNALAAEAHSLRLQLHGAREQSERVQQEIAQREEQAQGLLRSVSGGRAKFARMEQDYRETSRRVGVLLAQCDDDLDGLDVSDFLIPAQVDAIRQEAVEARKMFEDQLAAARTDARQAMRTREDALEKLDQLTASHAALEIKLEHVLEQFTAQENDMDALRGEAAAQVAAAHAQAGDIEREYTRLSSASDAARQAGHVVALGLKSVRVQLLEATESLAKLAVRLNQTDETDSEAALEFVALAPPASPLDTPVIEL